ncbi:glutamine-hydrolyzing carbamoyl-phosphate synthase small subunit [Flavobacteriaceae bacterium]|nr:glutamine-hydrolyzing carbamoyl-phosphate synthase small subunit [Flavobacteriaceae bacterium]
MKLIASRNINAVLCLCDGGYFFGNGVGQKGFSFGEICFNTSITGYQEILTDPSYAGQIITFTFPHIGNIGCNNIDAESFSPKCKGLVVREDITEDSNFRSETSLNSWLIKQNIIGISGIDTRALTKNISKNGAKTAIIFHAEIGEEIDTDNLFSRIKNIPDLNNVELASEVSTEKPYSFANSIYDINQNKNKKSPVKINKVVVIDYGVKKNILQELVNIGFDVKVVSAKSNFIEIMQHHPDGVFLSNGPGDPIPTASYAVPVIQEILQNNIPIFGICMGHQLLSIAVGLQTVKMHQGHRGSNHPVKNLKTEIVEITSQNHGFCVSKENIPDNIEITHLSLFDDTIEGIRLKDKPAFSVQYHPESSPGPNDSKYLFDEFIKLIEK